MKSHGGVYQHYYSRSLVTHVIATNLAGSKAASLSAEVKVCTPNWITDRYVSSILFQEVGFLQGLKKSPTLS